MSSQRNNEDSLSNRKQTPALAKVKHPQPEDITAQPQKKKIKLSQTQGCFIQQENNRTQTEKHHAPPKNNSADAKDSLFQSQNKSDQQTKNNLSQSQENPQQQDALSPQKNEHFVPENELLQREHKLAQQLKNACYESGEEIDPSKSATIIHKLGLIYRQRSPDKFSLIKSAGLLNAAIIRKPPDVSEIKQDLADLCKHILQQAEAPDQTADLIEKAEEVKSSFTQLRNEVDQFLSNSKSTENEISTESAQNEITTKLQYQTVRMFEEECN